MCSQARNLIWADLSEDQIENIRTAPLMKRATVRELVARYLGLSERNTPKLDIILDLYELTLKFGQVILRLQLQRCKYRTVAWLHQLHDPTAFQSKPNKWPDSPRAQDQGYAADKLSTLFSIMKEVHKRSTENKMPIERSFALFKSFMLMHSVQRPPYSVGVFTLPEFRAILDWGLDTYYRHYKLYQYAFTDRYLRQYSPDVAELWYC